MTDAAWKAIGVEEAQQKIQEKVAVVVDIRMPFDYAGGRVPGSLNLPGESLRYRKETVPQDKEVLVLSEDGMGSAKVCDLAVSLGYAAVFNIEGGFEAWRDAGYEMETISDGVFPAPPSTS